MRNAGLVFATEPAQSDERAIEAPLATSGLDGADVASVLAIAKAQDVSSRHVDAYVIGSDQTLTLNGEQFHKPKDMEGARRHLLKLSGQTHQLNSGVCLVRNGEILWQDLVSAHLTMRELDPGFIGRHLAQVGEAALQSVGAYQLEGPGLQLFDQVEGDYFTILGLPMLPLLKALRDESVLDG